MIWSAIYLASIIAANVGFAIFPPLNVGGVILPPMTLLVGFVFVWRDFAQRSIGHWVWVFMILGCAASWWLASPAIAVASATAFILSEGADWAVYTFTGKTLSQRILLSSLVATPIDSAVFLGMIGFASLPAIGLMTVSKMVGAGVMSFAIRYSPR